MQDIENVQSCEFVKDGVLSLKQYYNNSRDIARAIEQLKSAFALEYIHTIDASVHVLRTHDAIWDALKVCAHKTNKITNLLLYQYFVDKKSCHYIDIGDFLCEFKHITNLKLVLMNGACSIDEIRKLKSYFDTSTTIKNLQLESDYRTIRSIMELIESCEAIETIDLTIIDIKNVVGLVPVSMTRKIKKIRFSSCGVHPRDMVEFNTFFERFLALNSTIDELDLSGVSMSVDTVRIISDFVKTSDDLITLSVSCYNIDDEQIDILASALETSNVESLNINNNDIGHEGALSIAAMLSVNQSLKIVNIGYNPITYEGIIAILTVLAINPRVNTFYCTNSVPINGETVESIQQTFEQILSDNYVLVHFDVRLELEAGGRKSKVRVKLENITDRNKSIIDDSRFAKTKLAVTNVDRSLILKN